MPRKKKIDAEKDSQKPRVHKELEGFDIRINAFGEIVSTLEIEKINEFLDRHVDDKKLRHLKNKSKKSEE
ncbi:MAG: hypothetical protein RMJ97_08320 [Raineya sp.]|nr:hypothetical protein [Raineya sp.]MDW8296874.1 hypothetical protein [Raineya sp.]